MERHSVRPHPAYELGFGRCSCQFCIFGSASQWATMRQIDPVRFQRIADYETEFAYTIRNGINVNELADKGTPYPAATPERAAVALSREYNLPIIMDTWEMPAGAFGESDGPT